MKKGGAKETQLPSAIPFLCSSGKSIEEAIYKLQLLPTTLVVYGLVYSSVCIYVDCCVN